MTPDQMQYLRQFDIDPDDPTMPEHWDHVRMLADFRASGAENAIEQEPLDNRAPCAQCGYLEEITGSTENGDGICWQCAQGNEYEERGGECRFCDEPAVLDDSGRCPDCAHARAMED